MAEGYTYYNDIEHFPCEVLRKNIRLGLLPEGYVDERDIRAVHASDLVGYQHIHLFAGIGGFPLGFQWANVPLSLRIITGGFPCQDISNAGKRAGIDGERSGLWREMYRLICDIRPDYVCVENVSVLYERGIDRVLGDLARCGYDAEWQVLPAAAFGAPHARERLFIIAYPYSTRGGVFSHERGLHSHYTPPAWYSFRTTDTRLWLASHCQSRRNDDGIPAQLDRFKSLGNSIVPQIAEYIGNCIVAHHYVESCRDAS